jgi:hypothetical protein
MVEANGILEGFFIKRFANLGSKFKKNIDYIF